MFKDRRGEVEWDILRELTLLVDGETLDDAMVELVGLLDVVVDLASDTEVAYEGVDVEIGPQCAELLHRLHVLDELLVGCSDDSGAYELFLLLDLVVSIALLS